MSVYTLGERTAKNGSEDDFVRAWRDVVEHFSANTMDLAAAID